MDLKCECCGHIIEGLFPIESVKEHSHFYNEDCDQSRKWCGICWSSFSCKPCCGACYRHEFCADGCDECEALEQEWYGEEEVG